MSKPSCTLNRKTGWRELLEVLGVRLKERALPARITCPLCKTGILQISDDHSCGGQWFSCRSCGQHGDMIELAARKWGLSIPDAILGLRRHGFELPSDAHSITRYKKDHIDYRRRLQKFWDDSKDGRITCCKNASGLLHDLSLSVPNSLQSWIDGPGQFIGAANVSDVEACFSPQTMQSVADQRKRHHPGAHAIFRDGGRCTEVLVMPFYDLPGRICSFLCIGRKGRPERDFVFKRADFGPGSNQKFQPVADAGLSMPPHIFDLAERWGNSVFGISDPVLALRLQTRNLQQSTSPLPIAVFFDSEQHPEWLANDRRIRTKESWQILGNRKVIFWMPRFDITTISHAIEANGLISTVGPRDRSEQKLKEYCWKKTPRDLLVHIQQSARTWPEVLGRSLAHVSTSAVDAIFQRLEQRGANIREVLKHCPPELRERVTEIKTANKTHKTIELGSRRIQERDGKWWALRKRDEMELISDAILRIDKIVHDERTDDIYYVGRILHGGQELEFCERKQQVERRTADWMRSLLIREAKVSAFVQSDWSAKLVPIAELFHAPEVIRGATRVGWDAEGDRFVLPNYCVHVGGDVKPIDAPVFSEDAPAQSLPTPEVLSPEELDRPSQDDGLTGIFWATAAAIAHNVIAPMFGEPTLGIALQESEDKEIWRLPDLFGCSRVSVTSAKEFRKVVGRKNEHGWPMLFDVGSSLQRSYRRALLEQNAPRNCIVAVDRLTSSALSLRSGWIVLTGEYPIEIPPPLQELATKLIPAYLKYFCDRRGRLADNVHGNSLLEDIVCDLSEFVADAYGDSDSVLQALDVIRLSRPKMQGDELRDLLDDSLRSGALRIADEPDGRGKPTLVEMPSADQFYLTEDTLVKLLKKSLVGPPRHSEVSAILQDAEVLIDENAEGWVIDAGWLNGPQRKAGQRPQLLKISG